MHFGSGNTLTTTVTTKNLPLTSEWSTVAGAIFALNTA